VTETRQLLSDLDNTVFRHTLGSKNTVAPCKVVGESALTLFVRASNAVPHLEMHEVGSELSEDTRAFFGRWAKPDSLKEVVGFAGDSNNQFDSVSEFPCFLDPNETSVASVGVAVDLLGSVGGFVFCTVWVRNCRKLVHEPQGENEVLSLISIARPGR
jgi:hypothetical protein